MKTVEVGKYYRVRTKGYDDVILKYNGIGGLHHCKTCRCKTPMYTQTSGPSIVGSISELEVLEEVDKPKTVE